MISSMIDTKALITSSRFVIGLASANELPIWRYIWIYEYGESYKRYKKDNQNKLQ